jgi:2-polyprenyl-6-methoxyphenol hydroxylase-like FAD-dependent oxidoreductase
MVINHTDIIMELLNKDPDEPFVITDHDSAPYFYQSMVVMTGDAAHAFTPVARNGACQVFEDVSTILALLKEVKGVSRIPKASEAFDFI